MYLVPAGASRSTVMVGLPRDACLRPLRPLAVGTVRAHTGVRPYDLSVYLGPRVLYRRA